MHFWTKIWPYCFSLIFSAALLAGEVTTVYIGEGPSMNMADKPIIRSLKNKGGEKIGIYYEINSSHMIQVAHEGLVKEALASMLSQRSFIHPDDALYLAEYLLKKPIMKNKIFLIKDCKEVMDYMVNFSTTIYKTDELRIIRQLVCDPAT